MDSCVNGLASNGVSYACCNNQDNCNHDLTCIDSYSGQNVLTPGPSNCLFSQMCMVCNCILIITFNPNNKCTKWNCFKKFSLYFN